MSQRPQAILGKFREVQMSAGLEALGPDLRAALPHLARAMRAVDPLFLRQLGPESLALAERFAGESSPEARAFSFFKSPYDPLDEDRPFIAGVGPLRPGRALYPADLEACELEQYLAEHPEQRAELLDPYTVVERRGSRLEAVPYHQAFAAWLQPVARELHLAAEKIADPALASFVAGRAEALLGRKPLRDSEAEWVRLKRPALEVVVGPYEVYKDGLRGVKAFYEGMLLAVVPEACARIEAIEQGLGELAAAIPCPADSKSAVGGLAPLLVADELLATGDGASGVHSVAFNLPNDIWVRGQVGWKQILIRNMLHAKFDQIARPIAERTLAADQLPHLSFEAFFHFVLLHEVTHGLGPAHRADGRSVNEACGTAYSALEEAKADIGGLVLLLTMAGRHGIPALDPHAIGVSYLAGLYRSSRFGLSEAHGKANVIEYSFLKEQGALESAAGGVRVVPEKLTAAAARLLERLTLLQASGSADEIARFLGRHAAPPAELLASLATLTDLPVDIRPLWPQLEG